MPFGIGPPAPRAGLLPTPAGGRTHSRPNARAPTVPNRDPCGWCLGQANRVDDGDVRRAAPLPRPRLTSSDRPLQGEEALTCLVRRAPTDPCRGRGLALV